LGLIFSALKFLSLIPKFIKGIFGFFSNRDRMKRFVELVRAKRIANIATASKHALDWLRGKKTKVEERKKQGDDEWLDSIEEDEKKV
jgi:Rad3-related DNA helicase